jgi:predicted ATP-dependent endonuclease of OLD family
LVELNKIINPDILLTRIVPQQNDSGDWEIFFEDEQNNRIALSKMGSGIKTVLLVLLNLIVRPEIENKKPDSYIFAFEELENNLHPSLQRRLYSYIKDFSEFYNIYFFLTTHSNVVIDSFGTYPNAQLIHINKDSINAKTKTVLSFQDNKRILKDLDVKASDLLQSNSIIWVEGPSDRNYLNRWLEILAPDLHEGLHYSIMFYGGRLLSNLTFDFNWFNKEIIPLLKINSNAYVLIDRDGKSVSTKLNETKKRIVKEIGKDNYWVTKGREIENYLSENTVHKWLKDNYKIHTSFTNDKDIKFEDNILKSSPNIKIKYSANKSGYSSEIGSFIDDNSLDVLDLRFRLKELIKKIKDWNTQ